MRDAYKILVGKYQGKEPLGIYREDNIEIYVTKNKMCVNWIHLDDECLLGYCAM
jgi:hypothetical protein